jgi:hypothetical protein
MGRDCLEYLDADNIKMDLKEGESVDCIRLFREVVQLYILVGTVMGFRVPYVSAVCTTISF